MGFISSLVGTCQCCPTCVEVRVSRDFVFQVGECVAGCKEGSPPLHGEVEACYGGVVVVLHVLSVGREA